MKADTLNHSRGVGFESLGLNRTLGRSIPKFPPVLPVLLLSVESSGVNGCSDCAVMMLLPTNPRVQRDIPGIRVHHCDGARFGGRSGVVSSLYYVSV